MKIFGILTVGLLLILISGCAPRGETKALSEVLSDARSRFVSVERDKSSQLSPEVSAMVTKGVTAMEAMLAASTPGEGATHAALVEQTLVDLIARAGYTSRASLTELMKQYRQVGHNPSGLSASAQQLLMARTYSALTSELETTAFAL